MKRITCLMLDMGGVLTKDQRLDKVDEMMGILAAGRGAGDAPGDGRAAFGQAYYAERGEYDRGTCDGPEYWRRVARALGLAVDEAALPRLVRTDLESWFNMRPLMLEFLGGVQGRVGRTVLLSNIHVDGARYVREGEARAWASSFDHLVLSCEHGLLKPQREIYELALGAAGAPASETLFVDDSEANVQGARAAGLESFRFTSEEDFVATIEREYLLAR